MTDNAFIDTPNLNDAPTPSARRNGLSFGGQDGGGCAVGGQV